MDSFNSIPNAQMNKGVVTAGLAQTITGGLQDQFSNLPATNHGVCPTCGTCPTCGSKKAVQYQSPYTTVTTNVPRTAQWSYTQVGQNR